VQLFQAEWCPHSHRVRQRLTELGLDARLRQVPAEPEERTELERIAGTNEIPVLVVEGEEPKRGEEEILAYLTRFPERADAGRHRAKAHEEVPTFEENQARAA
jgi:glutaredoxin